MKLVNHCEISENVFEIALEIHDSLRTVEDKFFKLFDLNPCPISIGDLTTYEIIDVNDAFIKTIGLKSKNDVIGKLVNKSGLDLVRQKDLEFVQKEIQEKGELKNVYL